MNIFYLDKCPASCASYHNDKHCSKMILESAQLLSTAKRMIDGSFFPLSPFSKKGLWLLDGEAPGVNLKTGKNIIFNQHIEYKVSHANHPCAIWVRQSSRHWWWLCQLVWCLNAEQRFRKHNDDPRWSHASAEIVRQMKPPKGLLDNGFTPPPQCVPEDCMGPDTIEAYRAYYRVHKADMAVWTRRGPPSWY